MVQGSCLPPSYEEARKARKALPSVRWRRDRRARDALPDYATAAASQTTLQAMSRECQGADGPLDMSTRSRVSARNVDRARTDRTAAVAARAKGAAAAKVAAKGALALASPPTPPAPATPPPGRGSPPSYSEAISKPGYRLSVPLARPSVITCAPASPTLTRDSDKADKYPSDSTLEAGDGMCDPVIDEHFRRSLGKDYLTLFAKKTSSSKSGNDKEQSGSDGLSITGLSVDDHFAKALGDTWLKLQAESSAPPLTIPTVPSKSAPKSKEASNTTIPRPRRGLVTI